MSFVHHRACNHVRQARPSLEQLEDRCVPAVTAIFNSGILTIQGDAAANSIRVAADAARIFHSMLRAPSL